MLTPGKYKGTIQNYSIYSPSDAICKAKVDFNVKNAEGQPESASWYGDLMDVKYRPFTLKSLLTLGLKGDDISNLGQGVSSGLLDMSSEVELVIENYLDKKGVTRSSVKYINRPGGASFKDMDPAATVKKLAGLNLKSEIAAIRKETGIKSDDISIPF